MGYGISGMKNSYSNKALLDNWVEDSFGQSLISHGVRAPKK
jgi:hypothetical protein